MQCTIERALFLKSLSRLQAIVERRNTIPILSNIKLETKGDKLILTSTDMDIAASEEVKANVTGSSATTVPAHTLYEIVRKLPEGAEISIKSDGKDSSRMLINSGNSKFTLPCLPASDFPAITEGKLTHHFTLAAKDFHTLIDKARFAISTEETRYYLNGIYFHVPSKKEDTNSPILRSVATDGHRLARIDMAAPQGAVGMPGVIIPRKTVSELKRLLEEVDGEVQVYVSESKVKFQCGNVVLLSKVIDGIYPDYERVIPSDNNKIMEADGKIFIQAVDRVTAVSSEKTRAVKMTLTDGKMVLSASSPENGTAVEEVAVKYGSSNMEMGFNSRYLMDMLAQIKGDQVQFLLSESSSPALVRDPAEVGAIYVIMPMRI